MSKSIKVENYGDMLAQINNMELIEYREEGSYQGDYLAVLKDDNRLFYYFGEFGSCSGCDWIEDNEDWETGTIDYTKALEYCQQSPAQYIVPDTMPLEFEYVDYEFRLATKQEKETS